MKDYVRIAKLGLRFGSIHIVGLDMAIYWDLFNQKCSLRKTLETIISCIPYRSQRTGFGYRRECNYPGIGRVAIVNIGCEYHLIRRDDYNL